jgi:hypothetical protein
MTGGRHRSRRHGDAALVGMPLARRPRHMTPQLLPLHGICSAQLSYALAAHAVYTARIRTCDRTLWRGGVAQ